ncbi:hypothetical protein EI94DRAFT_1761287 [Lactarius quietus]|nr:hypothetical protein EI94DRAFT_1761287 [Lactarius quietus]
MITIIASSPHSWITRRYVGTHFATKLILFSMFLYFSLHNISSHCPQFKMCHLYITAICPYGSLYFLACCQWC